MPATKPCSTRSAGHGLGEIETLGVLHRVDVPSGAAGLVCAVEGRMRARRPVGHGDVLLVLDPATSAEPGIAVATEDATAPSVWRPRKLWWRGGLVKNGAMGMKVRLRGVIPTIAVEAEPQRTAQRPLQRMAKCRRWHDAVAWSLEDAGYATEGAAEDSPVVAKR